MRLWRHKAIAVEERDVRPRSDDDLLLDWLTGLPEGEARSIRVDAGWTQAEVADRCGIMTGSLVGIWERNGSGWSRHSGLRYARLLKELAVMRDEVVTESIPV